MLVPYVKSNDCVKVNGSVFMYKTVHSGGRDGGRGEGKKGGRGRGGTKHFFVT